MFMMDFLLMMVFFVDDDFFVKVMLMMALVNKILMTMMIKMVLICSRVEKKHYANIEAINGCSQYLLMKVHMNRWLPVGN